MVGVFLRHSGILSCTTTCQWIPASVQKPIVEHNKLNWHVNNWASNNRVLKVSKSAIYLEEFLQINIYITSQIALPMWRGRCTLESRRISRGKRTRGFWWERLTCRWPFFPREQQTLQSTSRLGSTCSTSAWTTATAPGTESGCSWVFTKVKYLFHLKPCGRIYRSLSLPTLITVLRQISNWSIYKHLFNR